MSVKGFWGKLFKKSNQTEVEPKKELEGAHLASEVFPVLTLDEKQLDAYKSIPLSQLASLGAAFSQLSSEARTIVQTVSKSVATRETLFVGINPSGTSGFLRQNEYGTVGNIMQVNSQGKQVIAGRMRFKAIDKLPITETTTTTLPIDPTVMVVAVAMMGIERKIDGIQKSVEEVFQFLKQEKQSEQRGNLNMLAEIMDEYKLNCRSEAFCASRDNRVLAIKNEAYQHIELYQKQIATELQKKKAIHAKKEAQGVLDAIAYQFAEYQLACHLFAFSTFLDVLLQKSFGAEHLESAVSKILDAAKRYETLYEDCYAQIEKYQHNAIESKILDGIGVATTGLGKAIGAIPVIKEGKVDEALISAGDSIGKHNEEAIQKQLQTFSEFKVNRMEPFVESLQNVNMLCNTENAMITDGENLYLLQSENTLP